MAPICLPDGTKQDWLAMAKEVMAIEEQGIESVRQSLDSSFVQALEMLANCKGRVVVTGVGKSGLVGKKISATLSSTGTPSFFLHPVEGAHGDLGMVRNDDVILAISNSGETDEIIALIPSLKDEGVSIIAMTGGLESTLARNSQIILNCHVPKEACPMGLAPTASTTAALALGDALAVCLIEWHSFEEKDFRRYHPGGVLGQRLFQNIRAVMHTDNLPIVNTSASVQKGVQVLNDGGLGTLVILSDEQTVAGILTDGDIRRHVCTGGFDPASKITEVMTADPRCGKVSQTVGELMDIMEEKAITALPIVDDAGMFTGLVHLHDLLGKGMVKFAQKRSG